jgi:hypothetical protein
LVAILNSYLSIGYIGYMNISLQNQFRKWKISLFVDYNQLLTIFSKIQCKRSAIFDSAAILKEIFASNILKQVFQISFHIYGFCKNYASLISSFVKFLKTKSWNESKSVEICLFELVAIWIVLSKFQWKSCSESKTLRMNRFNKHFLNLSVATFCPALSIMDSPKQLKATMFFTRVDLIQVLRTKTSKPFKENVKLKVFLF